MGSPGRVIFPIGPPSSTFESACSCRSNWSFMSTPTFADLGVPADLVAVLPQRGITAPFPIQAATLPDALAGRDVCGRAPTGSGKTIAFGTPARGARSASRCPAGPARSSWRRPASSPRQIEQELAPLAPPAAAASSPSTAASATSRSAGAAQRRRHRRRLPGPARGPHRARRRRPRRRRDRRRRRSRPHGRHGLPARRAAPARRTRRPTARRCCSRPPSTATSTRSSAATSTTRCVTRSPSRGRRRATSTTCSRTVEPRRTASSSPPSSSPSTAADDRVLPHAARRRPPGQAARAAGVRRRRSHGSRSQGQRERALGRVHRAARVQALVATDVAARGIHVDGVRVRRALRPARRTRRTTSTVPVVPAAPAPRERSCPSSQTTTADAVRCCSERSAWRATVLGTSGRTPLHATAERGREPTASRAKPTKLQTIAISEITSFSVGGVPRGRPVSDWFHHDSDCL